jgi:hypothetical protein
VSKIYEQILIPTDENIKEIPAVSFSFFNPRTRKYETLEKGPFSLTVEDVANGAQRVKMVSADNTASDVYIPQEELGEDILHIKDKMGRLSVPGQYIYENKYFQTAHIFLVFVLLFMYNGYRKKERVLKDKGFARFLKAPRKARKGLNKAKLFLNRGDRKTFFDVLFKTFQEYLGNKFNLSRGNVNYQVLEKILKNITCKKEIADKIKLVFEKSDMIRYSSGSSDNDPEELLRIVREIMDYLEKQKL